VLLATALRARTFPLAAQHVLLWVAIAAAVAQGLAARAATLSLGSLSAIVAPLALLVMVLVLTRPADHVRATLRRLGDGLELVVVVMLAPLLVGALGVYADLLERFR
jgi:hypothetical protein